jgi:DNA polymerase
MLIQRLQSLRRAGVRQIAKPPAPPAGQTQPPPPIETASDQASGAASWQSAATGATGDEMSKSKPPRRARGNLAARSLFDLPQEPQSALSPAERREALRALQDRVARCARCAELAASRTQTVFGVGTPQARLCFLGEAPGADEDFQGEPFVGRAGQLLTKIIEACTLRREDVYILNVLKCRPPGNRTPSVEEAANCREYLDQQLDIIRPDFICCLGAVAAQALLETTQSIGRLRGRLHDYRGVPVMVTYHPAYLLRNPNAKRLVWEDMQMLMHEMGIEIPERKARRDRRNYE